MNLLVNPKDIAPSQDFLKERTVRFIFQCIQEGKEQDLPPTPIVRRDKKGNLVAIDGHNLLVVQAYLGRLASVHVAEDNTDGLPDDSDANRARNEDLLTKFDTSLAERTKSQDAGIESFNDLIIKYKELFDEVTA